MKKILTYGVSSLLALTFLTGCAKTVAAKFEAPNYVVQFNGSDFIIGDVVSAEMPLDVKNPNLKNLVLNKAITDNKCDAILMPRYEIITKTFGKNIIKVTGRAAILKKQ